MAKVLDEYTYEMIMDEARKKWNKNFFEEKGSWDCQSYQTRNNYFNKVCREFGY